MDCGGYRVPSWSDLSERPPSFYDAQRTFPPSVLVQFPAVPCVMSGSPFCRTWQGSDVQTPPTKGRAGSVTVPVLLAARHFPPTRPRCGVRAQSQSMCLARRLCHKIGHNSKVGQSECPYGFFCWNQPQNYLLPLGAGREARMLGSCFLPHRESPRARGETSPEQSRAQRVGRGWANPVGLMPIPVFLLLLSPVLQ